ncbi:hypothetical protein QP119_06335 [Corynebacterium frankenforstense]|uniref:hypothetical protein n=1 Tax=Corynebacterium TaxID=1716 RepID=UPI00254A046B|nr:MULTISPECIES: hypothetical protein [Corynebacterium]MDK6260035.1 hypothetical protein [Corynebacterium frankenforstense]MDK8895167.1 hypothetical protein [Corynebacterium sp. MSK006]
MPPKVTENRPSPESLHKVEEETAASARGVVASYAEDVVDGVTLMCMLGVEPEGLDYHKFAEAHGLPDPAEEDKGKKSTKKSSKKSTKKSTKKSSKKSTKKTTKKSTKKMTKKMTKKSTKKS